VTGRQVAGRIFFFEKKKQKTFGTWAEPVHEAAFIDKSFFASFFSKKEASSFLPLAIS
jgi:hypothetical protein